ncbi:MAG: hypothetical protein WC120_02490 [Parcubacteria group bacterium]
MKKKIEKTKRDQQTVVLEDMNSKLVLVLEQFSSLNKKIDDNNEEFVEFKGEMVEFRNETSKNFKGLFEFRDQANENFKGLFEFRDQTNENFKGLFEFRDQTNENFKVVKEYLFNIDDEIRYLKSEFKEMKKNLGKIDQTEKMEAFEKRLVKLEKLVLARAK